MSLKMEKIFQLQGYRVQAPSCPKSNFTGGQSLSLQVSRFQPYMPPESKTTSVQSLRIQGSSCTEFKCPIVQNPRDQSPRMQSPSIQTIRPESSFSGMPFQISVLFIATGFVAMFCNNIETSLSKLLIQSTNYLINQ